MSVNMFLCIILQSQVGVCVYVCVCVSECVLANWTGI